MARSRLESVRWWPSNALASATAVRIVHPERHYMRGPGPKTLEKIGGELRARVEGPAKNRSQRNGSPSCGPSRPEKASQTITDQSGTALLEKRVNPEVGRRDQTMWWDEIREVVWLTTLVASLAAQRRHSGRDRSSVNSAASFLKRAAG